MNLKRIINRTSDSLKGAVNYERRRIKQERDRDSKVKWFDALPRVDIQRLYNKVRGRKMDLTFVREHHKYKHITLNTV